MYFINDKANSEVIAIYGLNRKTFKVRIEFDTFEKCKIAANLWILQIKNQIRVENFIKNTYRSRENFDEVLRNEIYKIQNKIN